MSPACRSTSTAALLMVCALCSGCGSGELAADLQAQPPDASAAPDFAAAAVPDQATADDLGPPDLTMASTDGIEPDAAGPDAATRDGAIPDGAIPDADRTDGAMPDAARTDGAIPDAARTDGAMTDGAMVQQQRSIAIGNHSFEVPVIPRDFTLDVPAPWVAFGMGINRMNRTLGVLNPIGRMFYVVPVPHGSNVGVVFLRNVNNPNVPANMPAGMEQQLVETLQLQTRYTLTVEVGNIATDVNIPLAFGGFPGYRIELLAGPDQIAVDQNTLAPAEGRFVTATATATIGAMHPRAGQPLRVRVVNLDAMPGIEVNFDNVRLVASP